LPEAARVVLFGGSAIEAAEAGRQLLRVGFDEVAGHVEGGIDAWRQAGLPVSRIAQVTAEELRRRLDRGETTTVLDVRTAREWSAGHLEGAVHVPVGDVAALAGAFRSREAVATICEGGQRSLLAASLLARAGLTNVVNVVGGMNAYRSLPR
jgi:hydroxyacylglutathione hydrolase